jgi:SPP1 family predicted phage head-tail adaptor
MGNLNSRQYGRRVQIQRKATNRDGYGQPVIAWTTIVTVWAWPKVQSGMGYINHEMQAGGTEVSRTAISYRIRKRDDVVAGMRLVDRGTVYDIRVVLPDLETKLYVDLGCATGASDG